MRRERRRIWLRRAGTLALVLVLLTLLLIAVGNLAWQQWQRAQGITHLDWQGVSLRHGRLGLDRLYLQRTDESGARLELHAERLSLSGQVAGFSWHLHELHIGQARVDWRAAATVPDAPTTPLSLDTLDPRPLLPGWFPLRVRIDALEARLPCASGTCRLAGEAELEYPAIEEKPLSLALNLQRDTRQLQLLVSVHGPLGAPRLDAQLSLDGQARLRLYSEWLLSPSANLWSGQLELPELPKAPWLLAWFEEWLGPQQRLSGAADLRLMADWRLQLAPGAADLGALAAGTGHLQLRANLPAAWPLPGIGQLQGELALQLLAKQGHWSARELHADLQLEHIDPALLARLPGVLQAQRLSLRIEPDSQADEAQGDYLPLRVQLTSQAPLQLEADARLRLHTGAGIDDWSVEFQPSHLRAHGDPLELLGIEVRNLRAELQLIGRLDAQGFDLALLAGSQLSLGKLLLGPAEARQLQLQQLELKAGSMHISGVLQENRLGRLQLQGPLNMQVQRLEQAHLQPLSWQWQGNAQADPDRLELQGALSNSGGLTAQVKLLRDANGALGLDIAAQEIFLHAGNPLAKTLRDWPALLQLDNGRLQLAGSVRQPLDGPLAAEASLQLKGVSGIYDRSEFSELDGQLQAGLAVQVVHLKVAQLQLKANPGIAIGPLQFKGDYSAPLAQPLQGQLSWQTASSELLGGRFWLAPGSLRLDRENPALPLQVQGLQLEELFRAYPAEGLSGQGTLDGQLPLLFGPTGIRVDQGSLAARAPGGRLQFQSERIKALGRNNPAMQPVADALENFHYSLLSSGVSYDEQGKLQLALRLEGRNPDLEKGRAINFNINLEEDIPALLTSLQLTGRVSERIRQRVEEHMRRPRTTAP